MMQLTEESEGRWDWRIALITVPAIVGFGSLSGWLSNSGNGNAWFAGLEKPFFMPPGWAFGLVWPLLYLCLGVALALILQQRPTRRRRTALILFFAQLLLNYAWSPIFFGLHDIQLGLVTILVMTGLAALTANQFWRMRRLAGALMIPYLAWLCFAAALNSAIGRLNPGAGVSLLG